MTGTQIYKTACAFLAMTPEDGAELEPLAISWLNSLLAEALPYENANRLANQKGPLQTAPQITVLKEEIPYCNDLCQIALPYGLASYLFMEDENYGWAADFRSRYLSALYEAAPYMPEPIVDVYGGGL